MTTAHTATTISIVSDPDTLRWDAQWFDQAADDLEARADKLRELAKECRRKAKEIGNAP